MIVTMRLGSGAQEMIRRHKTLGRRLAQAMRDELRDSLYKTQRHIQENLLSGQEVDVRTGALRRSWQTSVSRSLSQISGQVGISSDTVKVYAQKLNFGGWIRPTSAKYLAIPLDKAKTARGVLRGKYNIGGTDDQGNRRSLRSLNLMVYRSKAGNLLLVEPKKLKRRRKGQSWFTPLFVLKKQVYIRPRGFVESGREWLRARLTNWLQQRMDRELN